VEEAIDENTLLVVTGDHGHDLVHTLFYVNRFLQRRGWLVVPRQGGQQPAIDWSRTRAYALFPGAVFFNVAERWAGGCVAEREVPRLAEALGAELQTLQDPRTGRPPVKVVLDRDDLAAFGQRGVRAPDLFFCMHRGYEPATRLPLDGDAAELELTVPGREVTSGHGSFFPASASARTMAFLRGPGVAPGPLSPYPAPLVDLAPTMAAFLGVPPPAHCEGRPLAPWLAHLESVS
jgi:predicted AlkP superfamily phosphohydrolase/phosphomutase